MGWFSKVVDAVKGAAGAVADTASDAVDAVGDAVGDAADAVGDAAGDAAGAVRDAAGKVYDTAVEVGYELTDPAASLHNAGVLGSKIVETTGDLASKAIGETLGASILPDAIEDVGDTLADAVDESTDVSGDAISKISDTAASVAGEIDDKTTDGMVAAVDAAGDAWDGTKDVAGDAWGGIKDAAGAVGDAAGFVGGAVADGAGAVSSGVRDAAGAAFDAVTGKSGDDGSPEDEAARLHELADDVAENRVQREADQLADTMSDRTADEPDTARMALEGFEVAGESDSRIPPGGGDDVGRPVADPPPVMSPDPPVQDAEQASDLDTEALAGGRPGGGAVGPESEHADVGVPSEGLAEHGGSEVAGDGRPGAGGRFAFDDASSSGRAGPPDVPPGIGVAADAGAGRIPGARAGGGDEIDDDHDDLAAGLLGRVAHVAEDALDGDHLEMPDIDVRPHTIPMGVPDGDEAHVILHVGETDDLLADGALDDGVDEDADPDDDDLDL